MDAAVPDSQPSSGDLIALLEAADALFRDVLGNLTPEQMTLPTVNDEWTVRAVVEHVVLGNTWEAVLVCRGNAPRPTDDVIGDRVPLEVYVASAEAMRAAFAEPGALERTVTMPAAEIPASELAGFRVIDLVSHAWDLARATGQPTDFAPDLCQAALAIAQQRLGAWDRAQTPFKDEVPVPDDAPAADRLAAFLGKQI